jgi:hypothetical protein
MYLPSFTVVGAFVQQLLSPVQQSSSLCLVSTTMVAINTSNCAAAFVSDGGDTY